MLGIVLHAPRGLFYSPKAARNRWRSTWKANLAFCRVVHRTVRCTTRLSGAPPDMSCSSPVLDPLPYLAHPIVGPAVLLEHRTLSGATEQSGVPN
jgi:hypothetical protein